MVLRDPLDPLLGAADRALRALFARAHASRPAPGESTAAGAVGGAKASASQLAASGAASTWGGSLSNTVHHSSAALMRVNHAGEIAAQALYHGQALMARREDTRAVLLRSAREETDHLAWCATRLEELDSRPSLLNPLWYCASFAIGALAGMAGDRVSLGFVVETERQVEGHIDAHLSRLPAEDARSRAILRAMQSDELAHGAAARAAGGAELPYPVRVLMRQVARVMTTVAYWL